MSNKNKKRDLGEAITVKALQDFKELSQNQIANETGLTASAVSRIIDRLEQKGIVYRGNSGSASSVGRPVNKVSLNPESRFIISAYVSLHSIKFARINLGMEYDVLSEITHPEAFNIEDLVYLLVLNFKKLSSKDRVGAPERLLGFTVQLSGLTNGEQGVIWSSNTVKSEENPYQLASRLEDELGHTVLVESESNAALFGEMVSGAGKNSNNAVYVYYDADGMVLSFCFNGKIYSGGRNGYAGQLHGYAFEEKEVGDCRASHAYWLPPVSLSNKDMLALEAAGVPKGISKFGELFEYADSSNETVRGIIEERLSLLGVGLTNVCGLLSPEKIILGGMLSDIDDELLEIIQKQFASSLANSLLSYPGNSSEIVRGELPLMKAIYVGGASRLLSGITDFSVKKS